LQPRRNQEFAQYLKNAVCQPCHQGSRNCARQYGRHIVQGQPRNDRRTVTAGTDERRNRGANEVYDELIQSERTRTVDQWNPLKILFDNPHEADLKAAIMKLPLSDRTYMVRQMLAYIGQFRGYSWVKPILSASARRLFLGRY